MIRRTLQFVKRQGILASIIIARDLISTFGARNGVIYLASRVANRPRSLAHPPSGSVLAERIGHQAPVGRSDRPKIKLGGSLLVGTLDLPQCRKYRIAQRQEMIERSAGLPVTISNYRDVHRSFTKLQLAQRLLIYRVPDGPEFAAVIKEARRLSVPFCYDIDDPVFDRETVEANPNRAYLSKPIRAALSRDVEAFAAAMSQCDRITVSTEGLRSLVLRRFPAVACHVVPNGLDAETLHFGAVARQQRQVSRAGVFRVLLPSGSLAHAADTRVAVEGLKLFLADHPETELVTVGHFDLDEQLRNHRHFKELPYLAYSEYMRVLGDADCALVPLVDCSFNEGKSIVRLIDATAAGVPIIASPVGEYAEPWLAGTYMPARNPEDWRTALTRLATSPANGAAITRCAWEALSEQRSVGVLWSQLDPDLQAFYGGDLIPSADRLVA